MVGTLFAPVSYRPPMFRDVAPMSAADIGVKGKAVIVEPFFSPFDV